MKLSNEMIYVIDLNIFKNNLNLIWWYKITFKKWFRCNFFKYVWKDFLKGILLDIYVGLKENQITQN